MSKQVTIGAVKVGGGAEIAVQSMLSVPWEDTAGNVRQAAELAAAG